MKHFVLLLLLLCALGAQGQPQGPPAKREPAAPILTAGAAQDSVWALYWVRRQLLQAREESAIYQRAFGHTRDSLTAVTLRLARVRKAHQVELGLQSIRLMSKKKR
ncbi:hypothetical protein [Hymenobacter sp.]|uniref:hypothetical protein n=1 Tax=Hymenobacter sp. TaxID=1898978 RepID=UPI00286B2B47|nr:hypothetical protein [Hymenobacter sp.]